MLERSGCQRERHCQGQGGLYKQAIEAFDKAKELDPDKRMANWGYNRYQAYYGLYGADDPKTKAAEADSK